MRGMLYTPSEGRRWSTEFLPKEEIAKILDNKDLFRKKSKGSDFCKQALAVSKALTQKEYAAQDFERLADMCIDALSVFCHEDADDNEFSVLSSLNQALWKVGISAAYCDNVMRVIDAVEDYCDGNAAALTTMIQGIVEFYNRQILLHSSQSSKATLEMVMACRVLADQMAKKKKTSSEDILAVISLNLMMAEITGEYSQLEFIPDDQVFDVECLPEELRQQFNHIVKTFCFERKRKQLEETATGEKHSAKTMLSLLHSLVITAMEGQMDTYRINKLSESLERSASWIIRSSDRNKKKAEHLFLTAISALEESPFPTGLHTDVDYHTMNVEIERAIQVAVDMKMNKDEINLYTLLLGKIAIRNILEINELEGPVVALEYVNIVAELCAKLAAQEDDYQLLTGMYNGLLSRIAAGHLPQVHSKYLN